MKKLIKNILYTLALPFFLLACASRDYIAEYDVNDDALLDENEFVAAYDTDDNYYNWDDDNDNLLDRDEWDMGVNEYYDYDEYGTFDDWDYDNDGYLDENEYLDNTFEIWDEDNDGFIEDDEWYEENDLM